MLAPHRRLRAIAPIAFAVMLMPSAGAHAGTATIATQEGDEVVFEYRGDDLLRVGVDPESYMVVRDNTLYVVSYSNGEPMVVDASSMMKGFSGMVQQAAPSAATAEVVALQKTGRRETVAGIRGDVWELTVREDGKERTQEVVMSDDPRALEFREAMFTMARAGQAALDEELQAQNLDLQARLMELDLGVLRVGSDMKVTAISGDTVAAARFELPAEPMDMQGLGSMLGGMSQPGATQPQDTSGTEPEEKQSGGLFSNMMNAIGGKAERQTDRAEKKVDNKVDRETDNALDKAFGKLFGD